MKTKVVVVMLALIMVALISNPAFADRSTPVTVVNELSNPVPVINHVGEPVQMSGSSISGPASSISVEMTAPGSSQIFVMDQATLVATLTMTQNNYYSGLKVAWIQTTLNGVTCKHYLYNFSETSYSLTHNWVGDLDGPIYADSGTTILVTVESETPPSVMTQLTLDATVTGYLMSGN